MTAHERILQAASHIAGGMAAGVFAKAEKGPPLSKEMIENIVRTSVNIAQRIDAEAKQHHSHE